MYKLSIKEVYLMMDRNSVKINICLSNELKEEVKKVSKDLNSNISNFIREATCEHLKKVKKEILKNDLIEQCRETAQLNCEICDDFKYIDGENIE